MGLPHILVDFMTELRNQLKESDLLSEKIKNIVDDIIKKSYAHGLALSYATLSEEVYQLTITLISQYNNITEIIRDFSSTSKTVENVNIALPLIYKQIQERLNKLSKSR